MNEVKKTKTKTKTKNKPVFSHHDSKSGELYKQEQTCASNGSSYLESGTLYLLVKKLVVVVSLIQYPSSHFSHILVVNIHVVDLLLVFVLFWFVFAQRKERWIGALHHLRHQWLWSSTMNNKLFFGFFSLFHLFLCFLNYENLFLPKNVWDDDR